MNTLRLCLLATLGVLLFADSMFAEAMALEDEEDGHAAVRSRRDTLSYLDDGDFYANNRERRGNGGGSGSRNRFYLRWLARQRYQRYRDISDGSNQQARQ